VEPKTGAETIHSKRERRFWECLWFGTLGGSGYSAQMTNKEGGKGKHPKLGGLKEKHDCSGSGDKTGRRYVSRQFLGQKGSGGGGVDIGLNYFLCLTGVHSAEFAMVEWG